LGLEGFEPC